MLFVNKISKNKKKYKWVEIIVFVTVVGFFFGIEKKR